MPPRSARKRTPRKQSSRVVVDPVAAADQLGQPETVQVTVKQEQPGLTAGAVRELEEKYGGSQCALGHENTADARFCADCGLAMDAPAPGRADMEAARPKPAGMLSPEERTERDRQHAEALAAARTFENAPPVYQRTEGEAVLVHFIEDGLTFAGQVWYRGQEIEIGPGHPRWEQARGWILLDRAGQLERYGKQYFAPGPWPGRRSYLDGADGFEQLGPQKKGGQPFAGPGEEALRQADEAERRRGRGVAAPVFGPG